MQRAALAIAVAALCVSAAALLLGPLLRLPGAGGAPAAKIVIVPVNFVLQSPHADELVSALLRLSQRDDVAGVILLVNTPGGTVPATEALYATLRGLNKVKHAVVAGMAVSGGYYVAVAADRIYATPSSFVGGVGAIAVLWPDEYLYDIPDYVYTTGPLKYHGKELVDLYSDVDRIAENFLSAVVERRGDRLRAGPEVLRSAALFTASEALELGLVDAIGGVFDAARDMARELGLSRYALVELGELLGENITGAREGGSWRVPLSRLLSSSPLPVFYIHPAALELDVGGAQQAGIAPQAPQAGRPYVVLDMSHDNMIPRGFIEVLRAELARRGLVLAAATSESSLAELLRNATGLVVVNPASPFSQRAALAVINATARGVRVAYFYDVRSSAVVVVSGSARVAPYSHFAAPDALPMYFNMSGLRAVYNFTPAGAGRALNWQFVVAAPRACNWTLTCNLSRLVLFSPSAVSTNAPCRLAVMGRVLGYGEGEYAVVAQSGNFLFVGSVRSFTPYFIQQGDNRQFLSRVIDWLSGLSGAARGRATNCSAR
ncbi:MAG: S49 family peptidase [Thermoproteaceae archaeon]|jgi:ClpP class serine protease|nr:S49 family peptidase [Thermoproteaceae archaeon]